MRQAERAPGGRRPRGRLRAALAGLHLSRADLARLADISYIAARRLARGEGDPPLTTALRAAHALGAHLEELFSPEPEEQEGDGAGPRLGTASAREAVNGEVRTSRPAAGK